MGRALRSSTSAELHEEAERRLRALDQRYTSGRRVIVDVLAHADRPLTVPEIVERATAGAVPVSSAYRHMTAMADAGVVHRVVGIGADDHGRYELAEDLAGHHHHLLCQQCGSVTDVVASRRLERALDDAARAVLDETGFEVTSHRIDLVGRCQACAASPVGHDPGEGEELLA